MGMFRRDKTWRERCSCRFMRRGSAYLEESHRPQECKVCLENFDSVSRRPRSLPCGHTFCTSCISDLIKNRKISCPHCRRRHTLKQATELPISYIVEEFMAREKYFDPYKITVTATSQTDTADLVEGKGSAYCTPERTVETSSTNRPATCVSVTKPSSCCCCCCGGVFRRASKCLPNFMKFKRLPWRRGDMTRPFREPSSGHRRIYAIKEDNDHFMSAVMSLQDGRMFLHTLRDQPAPSTRTLKYSDMVALLDTSSTTAFMDLAWAGMVRGRVLITLYTNTAAGQIFLKLCTGEQGPTYANTSFLEVKYKGKPGEYVLAGGNLNTAEVHNKMFNGSEVGDIMCQTTSKAGLVWGRSPLDISCFGQFSITTRNPSHAMTYMQVLGKVRRGLEVVAAAAQIKDITEVKVVDCGVLVPL
ncbi:uncharacterized protein LOC135211614 isoform X2 [Macrobrachium nipponense]|uniref:uncharacterized protein LOC135211614 isoform X2 n=1 Tax=Macrobrachium nipponense TaxID=159736 RepID=UPI0030C85583